VLSDAPATPEALYYSGMIAYERGDLDRAVERLTRAVEVAPGLQPLRGDYGAVLRAAGRDHDAIAQFEKAIELSSTDGTAWLNLGFTKRAVGDTNAAAEAVNRAIALLPPYAPACNAQGVIRREMGNLAGAIESFRKAVEIDPTLVEAHSNLGLALHQLGRFDDAEAALQRAVRTNPAFATAHVNFGTLYVDTGDFDAAEAALSRAVALEPQREEARGPLVYMRHYDPAWSGEAILAEARDWARSAMATLRTPAALPHANVRDPERRLRVGYVSPDFRDHPCARFMLPLFMAHDRKAVEVFAYGSVENPDALTARFESAADRWFDGRRLTAQQLAERINADGIDILVDCAGLTRGNRLGVFAMRPAPVQVAWLGYPGTTGLDAIGYRITDTIADPPGMTEAHYTETLVRLARPFLAWDPPPMSQAPALPPAGAPVTFGSFNNPAKLNAAVAEVWTRILSAVPGSRLVLKYGWERFPRAERRVRDLFERAGLAPERLTLSAWIADHREHFASYNQLDIALDPFPYNGTTTTFEALWMGVPVVTLAGDRHSGRVGASLLTSAGVPELVAPTRDAYVAAAVALAQDRQRQADYRATLRRRVATSPLVDAGAFARALEASYRDLWRSWCAR
jgi:predicted O-linked N-acetylglucosamine transferase (SPINDLY family)